MNPELFNVLVVESREHLAQIEPELLELEERGPAASREQINSIFRAVHSIKGGFSFFGTGPVVRLAHDIETVLAAIRADRLTASPEVVDALLQGIDKLRVLVDNVASVDSIPIEDELAALAPFRQAAVEKTTPAPATPSEGPAATEPEREPASAGAAALDVDPDMLRLALRHGKHVYRITARGGLQPGGGGHAWRELFAGWQRYADVLVCDPARAELERIDANDPNPTQAQIVLASVLEPDLFARALGLADSSITLLARVGSAESASSPDAAPAHRPAATPSTTVPPAIGAAPAATAPKASGDSVLWVRVGLLDGLMNLAGELVLARNQLLQAIEQRLVDRRHGEALVDTVMRHINQALGSQGTAPRSPAEMSRLAQHLRETLLRSMGEVYGLVPAAQKIDQVTSALQEQILRTRMQPLSLLFRSFPRVVRDAARALGKEVRLVQEGMDVEVDRSIIDRLGDPLNHLVRNCVAHGIEAPLRRAELGKTPEGTLRMRAYQQEGKVVVDIQDDGAGIDPARVREVALARGVLDAQTAATLTPRELQRLVFMPGFSTAKNVDDYSGRGVGMDVVKTNVERLGGSIDIDSEPGVGTLVSLRMPLTLAIMPSLIVSTEGRRFAVPQDALEEVVPVRGGDVSARVERVHRYEVLRLREQLLPLVRLSTLLGLQPTFPADDAGTRDADRRERWSDRREGAAPTTEASERRASRADRRRAGELRVAVLRMGLRRFGLVVDDIHDHEEIVVKPLPGLLKGAQCYCGATIMGDGSVAMILDPAGVAEMAGLRFDELEEAARERELARAAVREEHEDEMLLFSVGGPERLAVPLACISRIEKRRTSEVEFVGSRTFVRSADVSLELLRMEDFIAVGKPTDEPASLFVVVPRDTPSPLGFRATHIADTVKTHVHIDSRSVCGSGVSGSATIGGNMVVVIDMPGLLKLVESRRHTARAEV